MFGAVTKYSWDFGDGAKAEGVTAEHTYTQKGKYTVTLTIFYQDGTQQVDKRLIEVK
jgi:PKD repeat protein